MQLLSGNRFTLGLGAGENLNEHVVGRGWKVNAELPGPAGFTAATQFVTKDDVADTIPCGAEPDAVASAVKPFLDAGFTDVALVQIGGDHQDPFLTEAKERILPTLRAL